MGPEPQLREAVHEDLLRLPSNVVGEILNGELVVTPRPAPPHASAASGVGADVHVAFHRRHGDGGGPGGWWIIDEPQLHLGRNVVVPDIAGWRRERMPRQPTTAWYDLPPDWVAEVLSPSTARHDRLQKMPIYGEHGVRHLWHIDPLARTVEAYQREEARWILLGNWGGDDHEARIPPFDAVALDLERWWDDGSGESAMP